MTFEPIKYYLIILERVSDLPNILRGLGIALLTILIPLAITILVDAYQKRKDEKSEFKNLDLHVILDGIFKIKQLLFYVILIFLSTMLWEISSGTLRFIEIILSFTGICLVARILLNVYGWVKGNVFKFRFSYLKDLRNHEDMEVVWRSVWETENINPQNETEFFALFSSFVDQLLEAMRNPKTAFKLLNDFYIFINNRSISSLVTEREIFARILDWHFKVWQKEYEYINQEKKLEEWAAYSEVSRTLDSIIRKIEERALKERKSFWFFDYFKKHVEKHKAEFVLVNQEEIYYIDSLLSTFYQVFFQNVSDSSERFGIWQHFFPAEWKITKNNLKDKQNPFVRISLDEFLRWSQERIWRPEEKFDRELDDISTNLFPEVEPNIWAIILIFAFSPFGEGRMDSVIQRPWNFGSVGRVKTYSGGSGESEEDFERRITRTLHAQYEIEKKNTFELTYLLFPRDFSKENLEDNIKNLEALKYQKESQEEKKRLTLLQIFSEMLQFLKLTTQ